MKPPLKGWPTKANRAPYPQVKTDPARHKPSTYLPQE